jgi:WD40 repeat protein
VPGNPYRGLECFEAEHAALYFGRERTARELLERLEAHPLVALIGVAGSGKSSLVRAGLPGAQVVVPGEPLPMPRSGRMVLVVDQFERLLPDDPEIDRVLELAGRNVRVVLAVRAEAYAQVLAHPGLASAIEPYTLPPMTHRELLHAIEEPARRGGCAFASGLAERIANDTGADLRPLGAALHALWERDAASGTLSHYAGLPAVEPPREPPAPRVTPPRRWTPAVAAALVFAVMLVLFPARRVDDGAASRALAAASLAALDARLDTALLLGLEAWRTADTPEARGAALTALQRTDRVRALVRNRTGGEVTAVARGGEMLAVADGPAVTLFRGRRRLPERLVSPNGTEPTAVAVSARGDRVAAAFGADVLLYARGRGQLRLGGRTTALAFSPDGTLLAGAGPRELRVWDAGGQPLHAHTSSRERAGGAAGVRFDARGRELAEIRAGRLTLWDTDTWRARRSLRIPARAATLSPDLRYVAGDVLWRIGDPDTTPLGGGRAAFSADSRRLAVARPDGTLALWDVRSAQPRGHPLTGGRDALSVAWDGALLVSGGRRGLTTLWNPAEPARDESGEQVAYGRTGALAWSTGTLLSLRERPGTEPLERGVFGHAIEFADDGRTLITGEPTRVRVFDLGLQQRRQHIADERVTAIASSRNLVAYGDAAGQVHVWPVGTFGELRSSQSNASSPVRAVALARDGNAVAGAVGTSVRLYDARLRDGPVLTGHDGPVTGVEFSPDGRTVASGSEDGTVRLWSRRTGAAQATLWANAGLTSIALSPDGRTLAGAEAGGAIRLWDVATHRPLGEPLPALGPTALAFAPDNRELVAGGAPLERWSGRLWVRTPEAIAGRICAVVARSLSRTEWRAAATDRSWRATCE